MVYGEESVVLTLEGVMPMLPAVISGTVELVSVCMCSACAGLIFIYYCFHQ